MNQKRRAPRGDLVFAFWVWVGLAAFTFAGLWFWGVLLGDWSVGRVAAFTALVVALALAASLVRVGWRRFRSS